MKALIFENKVIQIEETAFEVASAMVWIECSNTDEVGFELIEGKLLDTTVYLSEELQAEYDSLEYSRLRQIEYSKLNQDEMRFDDSINGTTTWIDAILDIKAKYPKPTEDN